MVVNGYKILEDLINDDLISEKFSESEKIIAINICQNNKRFDEYLNVTIENRYKIFLIAITQSSSIDLINYLQKIYQISDIFLSDAKITMCKYNQNLNVITHFLKHKEEDDCLLGACLLEACLSNQNLNVIKYLIQIYQPDHSIDRIINKYERNCLMCACFSNQNIEIIKYLIRVMHMNPLAKDKYGSLPLLR